MDLWNYMAVVDRIVDADTIDVTLDCGFQLYLKVRLRLARINAPEVRGSERTAGLAASAALKEIIPPGTDIIVHTKKVGSFGRYIAEIYLEREGEQVNINDHIVKVGHAVYEDY